MSEAERYDFDALARQFCGALGLTDEEMALIRVALITAYYDGKRDGLDQMRDEWLASNERMAS